VNQRADSWIAVGRVADIPLSGARVVRTGLGDIAVFRTESGSLFATADKCPHRGGPLSQGIVHGEAVTCPLHNWVVDLASGEAAGPDIGCVRTFPVRVDAGRVLLDLSALALPVPA
jgi:nitrite reductase (NADH) small subunit